MGCTSSSYADISNEMPTDWIAVIVNTETGDIMVSPTDGGQSTQTLAKFTMERLPEKNIQKKFHFVEQKIGGTWLETKSNSAPGGKVKFTCLDKAAMDAAWKEVGAKAWLSEETQGTVSTEASANSQGTPKRKNVSKAYDVGGSAEWQRENQRAKVFVMQGVINEQVVVVEKDSGEVVLNLKQGSCGNKLTFYETMPPKKGLTKEEEKAMVDKAFCGLRSMSQETSDDEVRLFLSPETLEKIPVSLFAMAAMYSSFTLNSMAC